METLSRRAIRVPDSNPSKNTSGSGVMLLGIKIVEET